MYYKYCLPKSLKKDFVDIFSLLGGIKADSGYPHDRCADKDSYLHDSNNQCIILRLQLSFVMMNVQLMLV